PKRGGSEHDEDIVLFPTVVTARLIASMARLPSFLVGWTPRRNTFSWELVVGRGPLPAPPGKSKQAHRPDARQRQGRGLWDGDPRDVRRHIHREVEGRDAPAEAEVEALALRTAPTPHPLPS